MPELRLDIRLQLNLSRTRNENPGSEDPGFRDSQWAPGTR